MPVYPLTPKNPLGCDLSHHNAIGGAPLTQGDFDRIKASGVTWVYLKATQGTEFIDPCFSKYRTYAVAAGLRVGAYHFFEPTKDAAEQASHFLTVVGSFDLPPALDLESTPGWAGDDDEVDEVGEWLAFVAEALASPSDVGRKPLPMIYTSMGWFIGVFGKADFSGHPLWLAHYASSPGSTGLWHSWTAWQYAQFGSIPGAGSGDVDTDVWSGPLPAPIHGVKP